MTYKKLQFILKKAKEQCVDIRKCEDFKKFSETI